MMICCNGTILHREWGGRVRKGEVEREIGRKRGRVGGREGEGREKEQGKDFYWHVHVV